MVLIADKDRDFADSFCEALNSAGVATLFAGSAHEAISLTKGGPNLCLAFVDAQICGLELMQQLHHVDPSLTVILMSAGGTPAAAVEATRRGAEDYITKPFDLARMAEKVGHFRNLLQGRRTVGANPPTNPVRRLDDYVCCSEAMRRVLEAARQVSRSESPALLVGERGVGKGLMARAIHASGPRAGGPFLRIDCPAFAHDSPDGDSGSSAHSVDTLQRFFEATAEGTIFLCEVGELPRDAREKLAGLLGEKTSRKAEGGSQSGHGPRVLGSSSCSLADLQNRYLCGKVYSQLTEVILEVPPLRSRPEDIVPLTGYFLDRLAQRYNQQFVLGWSSLDLLLSYSLPGNVRELESILERVAAHMLQSSRRVSDGDLRLFLDHSGIPFERSIPDEQPMDLDRIEQLAIERALWFAKGNRTKAAALLGIDRTTLHSKLRRFSRAVAAN